MTQDHPIELSAPRKHKYWHSRGYVPHFDQPGMVQTIGFRLHDSVPRSLIDQWKEELHWRVALPSEDPISVEYRRRIAHYEDRGYGECWLARPDVAHLVEDALLHFDDERYRVLAWCIMPNHVHVVVTVIDGYPLDQVIQSWKSFTAKEANRLLARSGTFWMPDYYDRYIRHENHLATAMAYVENNPVTAGLVSKASEWGFSSARMRG
jgi:putative DNA methylase